MAETKKPRKASPFAEMTFAQQQDMWRAWRSRQLDFRPTPQGQDTREQERSSEQLPPLHLPMYDAFSDNSQKQNVPKENEPRTPSHGHLDRLRQRHQQASRQAKSFLPTDTF